MHRRAPHLDLADAARVEDRAGVDVDHPQLDTRGREPGRVESPRSGRSTGFAAITGTSLAP